MCRPVLVLCEACQSEGRIYRGQYEDERDCGECPVCEGTGSTLVDSEAATLEDYKCEDCIGMIEHGCYCKSVGVVGPGGPLRDTPKHS